jgi:hypothetical protein
MKKIQIAVFVLLAMSLVGYTGQTRKDLVVNVPAATVRADTTGVVIKQVKLGDMLESGGRVGDRYEVGLHDNDTGSLVIAYIDASAVRIIRNYPRTNNTTAQENYRTAEKEIRVIANALAAYLSAGNNLPVQGNDFKDRIVMKDTLIYKLLVPRYLNKDPSWDDPWEFSYMIYFGNNDAGKHWMKQYGIKEPASNDFIVVSNGIYSYPDFYEWQYDPKNPEGGLYSEFDQKKNIIFYNQHMIRGKKK